MGIKGVIFDKDGTLLGFSDIWLRGFEEYLDGFTNDRGLKDKLKDEVGIMENGDLKVNSIIASGSIFDLANLLKNYSNKSIGELDRELNLHFHKFLLDHPEKVVETCDLKYLFRELKAKGIKIGIATADSYLQTVESFKILGVFEMIDFIATGDRFPNKPDKTSLRAFLEEFKLREREVIMVGDSKIDMEYGKDLLKNIGILSGPGSREMLNEYTDLIYDSPIHILDLLD